MTTSVSCRATPRAQFTYGSSSPRYTGAGSFEASVRRSQDEKTVGSKSACVGSFRDLSWARTLSSLKDSLSGDIVSFG